MLLIIIFIQGCSENTNTVTVLQYPYGAKCSLMLMADDLNSGFIHVREMENNTILYNPIETLNQHKQLVNISKKYRIPMILFAIPNFCQEINGTIKCVSLTEPIFSHEVKDNIENGLFDIGLHSRYHWGQGTPRPPTIGGYEDIEDWNYSVLLLNSLFNISVDAWRSPGYRSPDYEYNGYTGVKGYTDFRLALLNLGIRQEWDYVQYGYWGLPLTNGTSFFKTYSFISSSLGSGFFGKIVREWEVRLKRKLKGYNINIPLRPFILAKDIVDDPGQLNSILLTEYACQRGLFQAQNTHLNRYLIPGSFMYYTTLFPYLNNIGINKPGGVWIPAHARDVRDWYEVITEKNYKIKSSQKDNTLNITLVTTKNISFNYFSFMISNITNNSCPYLYTKQDLFYGRDIIPRNTNNYIVTVPINATPNIFTFYCSLNHTPLATRLYVDEIEEPVLSNESALIFAEYEDYDGNPIPDAEVFITIDEKTSIMYFNQKTNRYEHKYNPLNAGTKSYTIIIYKEGYESQETTHELLII